MSAVYGNYPQLPWTDEPEEGDRLRRISKWIFGLVLLFSVVIPLLPVPQLERERVEALPPRLAKLLLERQQQPPPPPKPKPQVQAKKKPEAKKVQPKAKPKVEKRVERARQKAQRSGLLAFQNEIAALRDDPAVSSALSNKSLSKAGNKAAAPTRSIISTRAGSSSGGIDTSRLSRNTGGGNLAGRSGTQVSSNVGVGGGGGAVQVAGRDIEDLRVVFDRNKTAIYAIYNRALRKDPSLQGKVVLELTIDGNGQVLQCRVLRSDIKNQSMLSRLVSRVKTFNFGGRGGGTVKVTYPIDFFPT